MEKTITELRVERLASGLKDGEFLLVTDLKNVRYLSGYTGTSGIVLLSSAKAYFLTDFRYVEQAKIQCPHLELVVHKPIVWDSVADLLGEAEVLYVEESNLTLASYNQLKSRIKAEIKEAKGPVEKLRMVKSPEEIELISIAARITDEAFMEICGMIKPGVTEMEIARELEFSMKRKGASHISFDFIVASGPRGALPHGVASDRVIQEGEFVTMDIGAVYQGYHSDMTRTVAVGEVSAELKKIYDIVYKAQMASLEAVAVGKTGAEIDKVARDIIQEHGYGDYFGHSLGHGVGLDIHEGPRVSAASDTVLEENMIITIEPGIYLPDVGGVRIEDLVVVEKTGARRLSLSSKDLIVLS